jgi:amino acid transporter
VLLLALTLPLQDLADVTARLTLVVFTLVNLSLARLKARAAESPPRIFVAPRWVPWAGAAACIGLLVLDLATMLAR